MKPFPCIAIPVLTDASGLACKLSALNSVQQRGILVVFVDIGSEDGTLAVAPEPVDHAYSAPRVRERQMNAGAVARITEANLFLHADSTLPSRTARPVRGTIFDQGSWGRFDVLLDNGSFSLLLVAAKMHLRTRRSGIAAGDKALFVQRDLFEEVSGLPELPVLEDFAISGFLKKLETANTQKPLFQSVRGVEGIECLVQCSGDLGDRTHTTLSLDCAGDLPLPIGTDCPTLTFGDLSHAAHGFFSEEGAVVYLAEYGGYSLVERREPMPPSPQK